MECMVELEKAVKAVDEIVSKIRNSDQPIKLYVRCPFPSPNTSASD